MSEVNKIKNDYEREKLQLNIYSALGMYKEAYELNGKMLNESFSFSRLFTQCILTYSAQRPKSEYEKCYADLAVEMQKELKLPHNNDAEYIASEWGYLLFMYQAGLICAELAGDFHLGYARQLTDKSSLLFDLAF